MTDPRSTSILQWSAVGIDSAAARWLFLATGEQINVQRSKLEIEIEMGGKERGGEEKEGSCLCFSETRGQSRSRSQRRPVFTLKD